MTTKTKTPAEIAASLSPDEASELRWMIKQGQAGSGAADRLYWKGLARELFGCLKAPTDLGRAVAAELTKED